MTLKIQQFAQIGVYFDDDDPLDDPIAIIRRWGNCEPDAVMQELFEPAKSSRGSHPAGFAGKLFSELWENSKEPHGIERELSSTNDFYFAVFPSRIDVYHKCHLRVDNWIRLRRYCVDTGERQ